MKMESVYGRISELKVHNALERVRRQTSENIHWLMDDDAIFKSIRDYYLQYSSCEFSLEMENASKSICSRIISRRTEIDGQTYDDLSHASHRLMDLTHSMDVMSGIHGELHRIIEERVLECQEVSELTNLIQGLTDLLEGSKELLGSTSINTGFAECVRRMKTGIGLTDIEGWMVEFNVHRSLEIKEREVLRRRMDMLEVYKNLYKENQSTLEGYAAFKNLNSVRDHSDADIESTVPMAFHTYEGVLELETLLREMTENAISHVVLESIRLIRESEDMGYVTRRLETVIAQVRCHDETDGVILRVESWMEEQGRLMSRFPGIRSNLLDMFSERNPGILELEMQIEAYQEDLENLQTLIDRLPAHVTQIELDKLMEFITRDMAILDLKESRYKLEEMIGQELQLQSNPAYMRRAMAIKLAHEKNRRQ